MKSEEIFRRGAGGALVSMLFILSVPGSGALADNPEMGCAHDEYYVYPNGGAVQSGLPTGCVPKNQLAAYWDNLETAAHGFRWIVENVTPSGGMSDNEFLGMQGGMR